MRGGIVGVILAGGKSSRMGGGDKPMLELGGEPMLARIIRRALPQVDQLAINANGAANRFAEFGLPVLADRIGGFHGPLAGIHAGLTWARSAHARHLLTIAGDTPFFPDDLSARLSFGREDESIVVAASATGAHPTFALWPTNLTKDLEQHLTSGGTRKVIAYIEQHGHVSVIFPPETLPGGIVDPFFNVNTPNDLADAQRLVQDIAR